MKDPGADRFSPAWGWALAGATAFPALVFALEYLPSRSLAALAVVVAGAGLAAGAALAAFGRRDSAFESARMWAIGYVAGVLVYLTWLQFPAPIPDNMTIVTPDGSPGRGYNDAYDILRVLTSIGVTLLLGGALDGASRAASGKRLPGAGRSAAVWAIALFPLPILLVLTLYAASIIGNVVRAGYAGGYGSFVFGLVCAGAIMGAVVGGTVEKALRYLQPSPRPRVSGPEPKAQSLRPA
jgi:hypothetical protein